MRGCYFLHKDTKDMIRIERTDKQTLFILSFGDQERKEIDHLTLDIEYVKLRERERKLWLKAD